MIDARAIVDELFTRDLEPPLVETISSEENTSVIRRPALIWSLTVTGQTRNGPGLWTGQLGLRIIGAPDAAWELLSAAYDAIHAWVGAGGVTDAGWVSAIDDITTDQKSTGVNTTAAGETTFNAIFQIAFRN